MLYTRLHQREYMTQDCTKTMTLVLRLVLSSCGHDFITITRLPTSLQSWINVILCFCRETESTITTLQLHPTLDHLRCAHVAALHAVQPGAGKSQPAPHPTPHATPHQTPHPAPHARPHTSPGPRPQPGTNPVEVQKQMLQARAALSLARLFSSRSTLQDAGAGAADLRVCSST